MAVQLNVRHDCLLTSVRGPAGAAQQHLPVPLTSFTLGALGVFYLSLSLSVLSMLTQPGTATLATYLRGTIVLLVVIVIAILLYLGSFHFSGHPRRIVYLGTHLVVLAGTTAIMAWHRRVGRLS